MLGKSVISVVDDDAEVLASLGSFFRSAGLTIVPFRTAEGLLDWTELDTMDFLITDLHMPGMDGLTLQSALLARGFDVPVMLMTAFPTDAARARSLELGIAAFVIKPPNPDQLLEVVSRLLADRATHGRGGIRPLP
ncbi:response regulator [Novosphingobium sp. Fuku2-ISO-50]|uniref:response regulator n=1 Tax=Novosphingobium sp. Fuku2-ISO-50 TaxID=1739114 RepID=UPI00076BEB5A|nr:response regulator [Novosphingobium sp. Fuku2-ISO-50]KUR78145.1 hypothetical protein AQZ50_08435 [Novosphingobium sp. Fuku2-ISO-50]